MFFSVTKTRQWQAKSGSVIIKTMIKCIFCFQWWERTGLKCYVWAQMQDIFPPIVHLVCLLKCNVSLFPILNRDLCRSLSCAWGRLGSHCLSITLTHTHTHAGRDRHSAPSSKNRDGQTFKSVVIPKDRNEKLMQCFLKAPAVGQTSD